jgi:hypothetical protein
MRFERVVVAAAIAAAATVGVQAQRRVSSQRAEPTVPVTIALKAGAEDINFTGKATCTHAPVAAIYGLRAERWTVEQADSGRSLTLALWHPASGSDLISLGISGGAKRLSVTTIKVGTNGAVEGSGTITLAKAKTGGTFTINAATADGTRITGTVKCDAFTPAIAEGGN